jgi:transcriptional regulator with XRE-family HTH domain
MSDPVLPTTSKRDQRPWPLLRTMVGEALRRTRLAQGRTLADVARAAKVSMPYLSELERGRKEASSEILAAVCRALNIEMPDLLEQVGRDLVDHQGRVFRLDQVAPARQVPSARPGPGDVVCLLAA